MGTESFDKGMTLEDTVELWLRLRGLSFERRKRLQTAIGLVEIDFLVNDERGKVLVEAKNLGRPVDRDIVLKAWNTAQAVGAYRAIVISSSGFTESAVRLSRTLERVQLLNLEELLREMESRRGEAIVLQRRVEREKAARWAEGKLTERFLFFIRKERVGEVEEVLLPLYLVRCSVPAGREKRRDVRLLVSGLTGLPIARRGSSIVEVGEELAALPDDVLQLYKKYAGKRVSRAEFAREHGENAWNRFLRHLSQSGLAAKVSERPAVVEIKDVLPRLEEMEEAAGSLWEGEAGGREMEHLHSPGSVALLLERLLGARSRTIFPVYAPAALVKLVDERGNYRHVCVAAWEEEPRHYVSSYFSKG
ncbi:MAG: restriction endonuclease [Acidilobaceae archaeon]